MIDDWLERFPELAIPQTWMRLPHAINSEAECYCADARFHITIAKNDDHWHAVTMECSHLLRGFFDPEEVDREVRGVLTPVLSNPAVWQDGFGPEVTHYDREFPLG